MYMLHRSKKKIIINKERNNMRPVLHDDSWPPVFIGTR